jgi:hypothetical protein
VLGEQYAKLLPSVFDAIVQTVISTCDDFNEDAATSNWSLLYMAIHTAEKVSVSQLQLHRVVFFFLSSFLPLPFPSLLLLLTPGGVSLLSCAKILLAFPGVLAQLTHGPADEGSEPPKKMKRVGKEVELLESPAAHVVAFWDAVMVRPNCNVFCQSSLSHDLRSSSFFLPSFIIIFIHHLLLVTTQKHLVHSHSWVRQAACRLYGIYFAARDATRVLVDSDPSDYLQRPNVVFQLGKQFCQQLDGAHVDTGLANQLVKNLLFVGRALLPLFLTEASQLPPASTSTTRRGGKGKGATTASADPGEDGEDEDDGRPRSGMLWTFKQLAFVARQEAVNTPERSARRECVFKWFAAMLQHMRPHAEVIPRFLLSMVRALYRTEICEKSADEIKVLASEVAHMIRGVVGAEAYLAAHTKVALEVTQSRVSRKHKAAITAVMQPALVPILTLRMDFLKEHARPQDLSPSPLLLLPRHSSLFRFFGVKINF